MMNEQEIITFTGCRHLDYFTEYAAQKQILSGNPPKVFWMRKEDPCMVQFCTLRGRMNHPYICLSDDKKGCGKYEEIKHTVVVPDP